MSKSTILLILAVALFFIGQYFYFKPNFSTGEVAPNFEMRIDNKFVELSDFHGNYVLLDFWGSWCGPCLKEKPDLVKLYDEFHTKKFSGNGHFDIISIGLETDKGRWQNAIDRLNLKWPNHYSDFNRMKSPIAKLYGVREIPAKFLINPEGHIVLVNSSIEDLRAFLLKKLK